MFWLSCYLSWFAVWSLDSFPYPLQWFPASASISPSLFEHFIFLFALWSIASFSYPLQWLPACISSSFLDHFFIGLLSDLLQIFPSITVTLNVDLSILLWTFLSWFLLYSLVSFSYPLQWLPVSVSSSAFEHLFLGLLSDPFAAFLIYYSGSQRRSLHSSLIASWLHLISFHIYVMRKSVMLRIAGSGYDKESANVDSIN